MLVIYLLIALLIVCSVLAGKQLNLTALRGENIHLRRQMSAAQLEIEQLQLEVAQDPLTGMLNRRGLEQALGREILRSERERLAIAWIVFDLDHFKVVNDTWGHSRGDLVLLAVAQTSNTLFRGSDVVARTGGEEFTALLVVQPDAQAAVTQRCEQLRVAASENIFWSTGIHVTVSIGWSFSSAEQADKNLYRAKAEGRNCVRGDDTGSDS